MHKCMLDAFFGNEHLNQLFHKFNLFRSTATNKNLWPYYTRWQQNYVVILYLVTSSAQDFKMFFYILRHLSLCYFYNVILVRRKRY